jgi:proteasome lid subunit RPN8/RPN11
VSVHRRTPLPQAPARGRLIVAEQVLPTTTAALQASSGRDGRHEGLVFWLGRAIDTTTIVLAVATPPTDSGPGRVMVDEQAVGETARTARAHGLGLVAQVHSHPGFDTRHSDGDDSLILMPYDGMFSLVVADFGRGALKPAEGAGLHQFQDGKWVQVTNDDALTIVPAHLTSGSRA